MDPESMKELLASIRKMMGKQRSCSTTDMGCRNMECCFIEGNEVYGHKASCAKQKRQESYSFSSFMHCIVVVLAKDCSQSLFYFVPQEKNITVKLARLSSIALQLQLKCRLIIALLNQGGYVDDDVDAIVTENGEDSEENEDEAPSRELVTLSLCQLIQILLSLRL